MTSRTKPDEFGFRRVKLESVVRHPDPNPTDAVDKHGCEMVHVVDNTVVVVLHVIHISMNGEAVLVSDTEDICCKKDKIERSEHRALRHAAFNHGYVRRRPTVWRRGVRIVSYLGCKRRSNRVHFRQFRIPLVAGRESCGQRSRTRHSCRASRTESTSLDPRRKKHQT